MVPFSKAVQSSQFVVHSSEITVWRSKGVRRKRSGRSLLGDCGPWVFRDVGVLAAYEGPDAGESHDADDEAEGGADVAEAFASDIAGSDTPLGGKKPDAIGEVPADGDHGDDVKGEQEWVLEFLLNFVKG